MTTPPDFNAPREVWQVFADELLTRGSARGELIRLHLELEATGGQSERLRVAERRLHTLHRDALLGPRGVLAGVSATWRRGYIEAARSPGFSALRALLTHESGTQLRALLFDNPHLGMDEQLLEVGQSAPDSLREVRVRTDSGGVCFEGPLPIDALFPLGLDLVEVHARSLSLTKLAGRALMRTLELSCRSPPLERLFAWTFERLKRLELASFSKLVHRTWAGAVDYPVDAPCFVAPARFTSGEATPCLSELALRDFRIDDDAAQSLTKFSTRKRPTLIDLSGCALERSAFASLRTLGPHVQLPPEPASETP